MRRELLASVSAIALVIGSASAATLFSDPAKAADLARKAAPPPMVAPAPVYSWTGCYVGAHVGWGWGHNDHTQTSFSSHFPQFRTSQGAGVSTNGALFGGQVGCNYQFAGWSPWQGGNWVVGVQGDFAGTDINGKGQDPFGDGDELISVKTEWLASVTGRIGVTAWNNQALFYVKGGGAWARNQWDLSNTILEFDQNGLFSETRSGWTVGGGVEWTLWSPNWTAFVEYNFYRFNDGSTATTSPGNCGTSCTFQSGRQEINTVKVGVNYKFNWFGGGY
jgi:outer membrane immunogenic protein